MKKDRDGRNWERMNSERKAEVVMRLLRGESLDALSREFGVTAGRMSKWRDEFVLGGKLALKSRKTTVEEERVKDLKAALGDATMRLEIHRELIRMGKLKPEHPFVLRRLGM